MLLFFVISGSVVCIEVVHMDLERFLRGFQGVHGKKNGTYLFDFISVQVTQKQSEHLFLSYFCFIYVVSVRKHVKADIRWRIKAYQIVVCD